MRVYKRNQVEEALSRVLADVACIKEPSSEVRACLNGLLDLDRRLGPGVTSNKSTALNYAFYSADAPGEGVKVEFSPYEVFALFNALRMQLRGFPQSVAVTILRLARRELERTYPALLAAEGRGPSEDDILLVVAPGPGIDSSTGKTLVDIFERQIAL